MRCKCRSCLAWVNRRRGVLTNIAERDLQDELDDAFGQMIVTDAYNKIPNVMAALADAERNEGLDITGLTFEENVTMAMEDLKP